MRMIVAAVTPMVLLCACSEPKPAEDRAAATLPTETPVRKPGLWRQTVQIDDRGLETVELCIDAASDAKLAWWGQPGLAERCSTTDMMRRADGAWRFHFVCSPREGVQITTNGSAVGDFQSRYQLKSEITTRGAQAAGAAGTRLIALDAEWTGPCRSGMAPGDLERADGQKINLLELAKSQGEAR